MSPVVGRVLAMVLALAALLGAVASLAAIPVLWSSEAPIIRGVDSTADAADRSLAASIRLLEAVSTARVIAKRKLDETQKTLVDVSTLMNQAAITMRTAGALTGKHMTQVIRDVDTTLASLETTTKLVDDIIAGVNKIPFVSTEEYKPAVPLSESMRRMRVAFQTLPPELGKTQSDLAKTAASIEVVRDDMKALSGGLDEAEQAIGQAATAADEHRAILAGVKGTVTTVRGVFPGALRAFNWIMTAALLWLALWLLERPVAELGRGRRRGGRTAPLSAEPGGGAG
jgi:methyl-accepting chemotaxis protein